jgi:hypothetical protein
MRTSILALGFVLSACSSKSSSFSTVPSAPWISKGAVLYQDRMENTPVVWTDGSTVDVLWSHDPQNGAWGSSIELHRNGSTTSIDFSFGYVNALVSNGVLYVFGSAEDGSSVSMISSSDLVNFTSPIEVLSGSDFANISVSPDASGFVMAVERCANSTCYTAAFYHSTDLLSWNNIGGFEGAVYTACPTVRFSNGYYYVFYLSDEGDYFATRIARSKDLSKWEFSSQAVVSPGSDEGVNASDLDLMETTDGNVRILYAIGYQTVGKGHFVDVREAGFQGTLDQFLTKFFSGGSL